MAVQKTLSAEQIKDFYHQNFVRDQVTDFEAQVPLPLGDDQVVLDVGGGFGFFAEALARKTGVRVRVLDSDPVSVDACRAREVDAELSDALQPKIRGDEAVVSFNLILHHLIGATASETADLQRRALQPWRGRARFVLVNEYIYESWGWPGTSAWFIWSVTSSQLLSRIGTAVSKFVPSLRALLIRSCRRDSFLLVSKQ